MTKNSNSVVPEVTTPVIQIILPLLHRIERGSLMFAAYFQDHYAAVQSVKAGSIPDGKKVKQSHYRP
jgi:hypothetical protein